MNKLLQKTFYVFIISVLIFSASANAQIIYTDVIPDSTMYCGSCGLGVFKTYDLDLNNDGIKDFTLRVSAGNNNNFPTQYNKMVYVSPLNGNAVKDTLVNPNTVTIPLQFNAVIDSNLLVNQSWQTSGLNTLKDTNWYSPPTTPGSGHGLWNNLSDYYLGLRLLKSGQAYYGWIRLRVDVTQSYASLIVKDYAYNSIPNQAILAGQTTATGINENSFASSINLFPNPANNHVTIALGSISKKVDITIADITGKIIYTTSASETQKIEVNTQDFAEGIYVVQIQAADFIATKKLVVKK